MLKARDDSFPLKYTHLGRAIRLLVSCINSFKLLFSLFHSPFVDRSSEEERWNISTTTVECSTAGARNQSQLDLILQKDVFAHKRELSITNSYGALSPELGSPWTHSRALPRVVAKSTKFHEELSHLGNGITMHVILESIDCIK